MDNFLLAPVWSSGNLGRGNCTFKPLISVKPQPIFVHGPNEKLKEAPYHVVTCGVIEAFLAIKSATLKTNTRTFFSLFSLHLRGGEMTALLYLIFNLKKYFLFKKIKIFIDCRKFVP